MSKDKKAEKAGKTKTPGFKHPIKNITYIGDICRMTLDCGKNSTQQVSMPKKAVPKDLQVGDIYVSEATGKVHFTEAK